MATVDYTEQGTDPDGGPKLAERAFADNVVVHGNATKAFRDAGYVAASYGTARAAAATLLMQPNISEYVNPKL